MKHLYLFYTFITFGIGLISSGIVIFLYFKTKEAIIRYYLFFFTAFSFIGVSSIWLSYMYTNIPGLEQHSLDFIVWFFGALWVFVMAVFMHFLVNARYARLKNALVGAISLFIVMSYLLTFSFVPEHHLLAQILQATGYILFFIVFLYVCVVGLFGAKQLQDQSRKHVTYLFSWILLLLVPVFFVDFVILHDRFDFAPVFSPLLYASISTIFLVQFIKLYGYHHETTTETSSQKISLEKMFEQYMLSPREQEVARLVLEGRSNQKIGEELFISLSTVKTHVSNVYQKFDVKNRVEFITSCQNARAGNHLSSTSSE